MNNEQFSYSAKWSTKLIWLALKLFNVGWGTDEKKVISVIAHRDAAQRQQSQQAYEELYKEKLSKRLESELTGQFEVLYTTNLFFQVKLVCSQSPHY